MYVERQKTKQINIETKLEISLIINHGDSRGHIHGVSTNTCMTSVTMAL